MTNILGILRSHKIRKHVNTIEEHRICDVCKGNLQMNDTNLDTYNPIFRAVKEMNTAAHTLYVMQESKAK
jgi:hypothetical protein